MSAPIRSIIVEEVKDKLDDPKASKIDLIAPIYRMILEYNAMRAQLLRLEGALHESIKMIEGESNG